MDRICVWKERKRWRTRERYYSKTHIQNTHKHTPQMRLWGVYIVSDIGLKGFLMDLGLDLVYMDYDEYITYTMLAWPSP